jgi:hypothetical protein
LKQLKEANKLTISQMKSVRVSVAVTPIISKAVDAMKGKTADEAIRVLIGLHNPPSVSEMKKQAELGQIEHPLVGFAEQRVIVSEGNVAARSKGHLPDGSDESFLALSSQYDTQRKITAVMIESAREELTKDPKAQWKDSIARLVAQNGFLGPDHKDLLTRGLQAGLDGDLVEFVHLAVPQIESLARAIVADGGGKITSLKAGVAQEIDLNQMLTDAGNGLPILVRVLGDDLTWDMRMLLVESAGPNLRNRVCHGLASMEECTGAHATYLLWQTLHLLEVTAG